LDRWHRATAAAGGCAAWSVEEREAARHWRKSWEMRLNQFKRRCPQRHLLLPAHKSLAYGAFFGCGLLVITEFELLAIHDLRHRMRLKKIFENRA
jgi:hypothetical protein